MNLRKIRCLLSHFAGANKNEKESAINRNSTSETIVEISGLIEVSFLEIVGAIDAN